MPARPEPGQVRGHLFWSGQPKAHHKRMKTFRMPRPLTLASELLLPPPEELCSPPSTHQSNQPRRHFCSKSEGIGPPSPYRRHACSKSEGTPPLLCLDLCSTSDGTLRYALCWPRHRCSRSDGGFLPYRRRHCCSTSEGTPCVKCSIVSLTMSREGRPCSSGLAGAWIASSERAKTPVVRVTTSLFMTFSDSRGGPMWLMPHRSIAPDPEKGVNIASSCCSYSRLTTSQPRLRFRNFAWRRAAFPYAPEPTHAGHAGLPLLGSAAFQIDRGLQVDHLHQTESAE